MKWYEQIFKTKSVDWKTPKVLRRTLHREFGFDCDPCPFRGRRDGLAQSWGKCSFVNPPYGRDLYAWVRKAYMESRLGKTVVMLLPVRTDTRYWHEFVMRAHEWRMVKGGLAFSDGGTCAPFASVVVVFDGKRRLPMVLRISAINPDGSRFVDKTRTNEVRA